MPTEPAPLPASSPVEQTPASTPTSEQPPVTEDPSSPAGPAATLSEQQPLTSAVVMGGEGSSVPPTPVASAPKKRWTRKRLLLLVALPLVVVLAGVGIVFGLYLPNTPDGVWNTGLNRTGTALDKLTTTATEAEQLDKLTASELTGKIDATWEGGTFSGDVKASFDQKDTDSGLNIAVTDETGKKRELSAKLLTQLKKDAKYPDVYFQLKGFANMGLDTLVPGINAYDGKWIVADSKYIESMIQSMGVDEEATKREDITSADIHEVTKVITSVTNEYVFTTDADKAILVQKSFVGKEDLDGTTAHHYKATINNDNAKAYCVAVARAVLDTKVAKKLSGADNEQLAKYKKDASKDCDEDYVPKEDMDVWIGGKYRLIQKIRFNMADSTDYIDVGQQYDNGDEVTLYATYNAEDKSSTKFSVTMNVKTYDTSFGLIAKGDSYNVTVNVTAKASDEDVKVTPPAGAVPFEQFMNAMQQTSDLSTQSRLQAEQNAAEAEEWANNAGSIRFN